VVLIVTFVVVWFVLLFLMGLTRLNFGSGELVLTLVIAGAVTYVVARRTRRAT
jgi:hypothetical protein